MRFKEKTGQKVPKKQSRFKKWRNRRPFWGATLTALAGLLILWIPVHLYAIAFAPGTFAFVGLLFGGLILLIGIMSYIYPHFSSVFGVMTIFLSVLSIMGALGGFVIGTILGIIGGSLCIAWKSEVVPNKKQGFAKTSKKDRSVKQSAYPENPEEIFEAPHQRGS